MSAWSHCSAEVQRILEREQRARWAEEEADYARWQSEREQELRRAAGRPTREQQLKALVEHRMRRRFAFEMGVPVDRVRRR